MPLPRGDEYNQAVQNPRVCFSDNILQSCHVETNPLGLPKPYSGGFTTTYRLLNSSHSWAVRCFTREISDLQRRYHAIGNFLSNNTCEILVDAKYLSNGIKVNGIFHPIIKMKWLDGEPLNNYITKVHQNKGILQNTLSDFDSLIKTLERFGIAHGDLQHGNIIVKNNKQYLIDYDGMYFPELSSLRVNELGHPNFQHPKRTTGDFNQKIDRFAAIVIYTALKSLTIAPSLWTKFDNGDNLLFTGKDFNDPQNSQLIRELIGYTDLTKLANNLIAVCSWDFNKIPTLAEFITSTYTPPVHVAPVKTVIRSPYPVIDAFQRGRWAEYFGQKVVAVGKLTAARRGTTRRGDPYLFLNFGMYPHQSLTIVLWSDALSEFRRNNINPANFVNNYISVTGVLGSYQGKPQISIDYSNQIQKLSGEEEAENVKSSNGSIVRDEFLRRTIPVSKKEDDFDLILNEIYKSRRATPKPTSTIKQSVKPTLSSTSKTTSTYKSPTSTKIRSDRGCIIPIVFSILGGIIGTVTTGEAVGFLNGAFVGAILGGIIFFIRN